MTDQEIFNKVAEHLLAGSGDEYTRFDLLKGPQQVHDSHDVKDWRECLSGVAKSRRLDSAVLDSWTWNEGEEKYTQLTKEVPRD